jgi:thiamine monophosphate synthase
MACYDLALAARPGYIALGPSYPTILKQMKLALQGSNGLANGSAGSRLVAMAASPGTGSKVSLVPARTAPRS